MNAASIGVFDSGLGGLSVVNALATLLPYENIIYFGDTKNMPYGDKTPEKILAYSLEAGEFLAKKNIKLLVLACHTASIIALPQLQKILPVPVIGIGQTALEHLLQWPENSRLGILATSATISSPLYKKLLQDKFPNRNIFAQACPLFVPLIESGKQNDISLVQQAIQTYLSPLKEKPYPLDVLLLACTHYPFIQDSIQKELDPHTTLVDPAMHCAKVVKAHLIKHHLTNICQGPATWQFYVSGDPNRFHQMAQKILHVPIKNVLSLL